MTAWSQRWWSGAVVALLAGVVAVGLAGCTGWRDGQIPQPAPTTPRQLRNPVSVQVIVRIDQVGCVAGAGGLPGPGAGRDWCYFLDPGLELTRAEQVELTRDGIGDPVVVTLAAEDRDAFAAWTARSAGHQIAITVQGRVVAAPDLLEPLSGDSLFIGLGTEADARTLLHQLWE